MMDEEVPFSALLVLVGTLDHMLRREVRCATL